MNNIDQIIRSIVIFLIILAALNFSAYGQTDGVINAASQYGSDICDKVNTAESALPPQGGEIMIPAGQYTAISHTCSITKPTNLHCAAPGFGALRACSLQFSAGTPGLTVSSAAQRSTIAGLYLLSSASTAGSDNGILVLANAVSLNNIVVDHFGGAGISVNASHVNGNNANTWEIERVHSQNNLGDGFYFAGTDANAGTCTNCVSVTNSGWGFNIASVSNTFITPEVEGNSVGGYQVSGSSNRFLNTYAENGTGSSFVLTSGSAYNRIDFSSFGKPQTIQDNSTVGNQLDTIRKHQVFGPTCATGPGIGNSCQMSYTWATPFPDSNYSLTCMELHPSGAGTVIGSSKTATGFSVIVISLNPAAHGADEVDCVAEELQ